MKEGRQLSRSCSLWLLSWQATKLLGIPIVRIDLKVGGGETSGKNEQTGPKANMAIQSDLAIQRP